MNEELVKEWAVKAEEDYLTVEELFKIHVRRFATIICFHSQQCAEKYLKALLIACNIEPPRTYSLETLLDLIVSEVPELEQYRDMLTDLNPVQRTISISGSGGNPGRCQILCQDYTRTA